MHQQWKEKTNSQRPPGHTGPQVLVSGGRLRSFTRPQFHPYVDVTERPTAYFQADHSTAPSLVRHPLACRNLERSGGQE